jgi:hypothetical protein
MTVDLEITLEATEMDAEDLEKKLAIIEDFSSNDGE